MWNKLILYIQSAIENPSDQCSIIVKDAFIDSEPLIVIFFTKQEDANAFIIQLAPKSQMGRLLAEINNDPIFIRNGTVFYLNFPYESVTYKSAPPEHLRLRVTYSQSLNNLTLSMRLVTSTQGFINITYPPVADNNPALKVYSSQQYDKFLIFKKLIPIFSYALWFILLLVFFFVSKMIAIETLFIFQFTYGGLIMLKKLQPVMYSYKYLDKLADSEPSRMKLTETKDQNSSQKHYEAFSEPPLTTVRRQVSSQIQSKKDEPPDTAYKLRS